MEFGRTVTAPKGIFCRNFTYSHSPWGPCHQVWCGRYHKVDSDLDFHVAQPMNDQGIVFKRNIDKDHF